MESFFVLASIADNLSTLIALIVSLSAIGVLLICVVIYFIIHANKSKKLKKDFLTKAFSYPKFLITSKTLIRKYGSSRYVFTAFNIVKFRFVSLTFGEDVANKIVSLFVDTILEDLKGNQFVISRQGGDRFTVFADINNEEEMMKRVKFCFFKFEKAAREICQFKMIVHCGAYFLNPGDSVELAAEKALNALSFATDEYNPQIIVYTPKLEKEINKGNIPDAEIARALKNGEFIPYFQPKVNIDTSELVGVEMLVRWNHPTKGILPPSEFIPTLERIGLLSEIDMLIFEYACSFIKKRIDNHLKVVPVATNFSAAQVNNHSFYDDVINILKKYGIPYELIEMEITESIALRISPEVREMFKELQKQGLRITIDDFGSGYSSLGLLTELNANSLKMDRSFLLGDTKKKFEVIRSSVVLATRLGMTVVFEGVETVEHLSIMRKVGAIIAQGYFYSKPIPENQIVEYIDKHAIERPYENYNNIGKADISEAITDNSSVYETLRDVSVVFDALRNNPDLSFAIVAIESNEVKLKFFSQGFCKMFSLGADLIQNPPKNVLLDRVNLFDIQTLLTNLKTVNETGKDLEYVLRCKLVDHTDILTVSASFSSVSYNNTPSGKAIICLCRDISRYVQTKEQLDKERAESLELFNNVDAGIVSFTFDENGKPELRKMNIAAVKFLGVDSISEIATSRRFSWLYSTLSKTGKIEYGKKIEFETAVSSTDHKIHWVTGSKTLVKGQSGDVLQTVFVEITKSKIENSKFQQYFQIITTTLDITLFEYKYDSDTFSFLRKSEALDFMPPLISNFSTAKDNPFKDVKFINEYSVERQQYAGNGSWHEKIISVDVKGKIKYFQLRYTNVADLFTAENIAIGSIEDITLEKERELLLMKESQIDSFTKLLNKTTIIDSISNIVKNMKNDEQYAIIIADIDNLKKLNDNNGHAFGDYVISNVTKIITEVFASGKVGRFGGDEFLIIDKVKDKDEIITKLDTLMAKMNQFDKESRKIVPLCISVGVSFAKKDGDNYYDLFCHADEALYASKQNGKNKYTIC